MTKVKKQIYICTRFPKAYGPLRLDEAASLYQLNSRIISYTDITIELNNQVSVSTSKGDLEKPDFVFFRNPGSDNAYNAQFYFLLQHFKRQKAFIMNEKSFDTWFILDKVIQMYHLQEHGLPFVPTRVFANKEVLLKAHHTYPFIAKGSTGSHGNQVYKITSLEDLETLLSNPDILPSNLLIQPFLPTSEDLRVIVIGGVAIGAMRRMAKKGEYLTNYSAGGTVELYDLEKDKEACELAVEVAKCFYCDYAGVDLMKDKEGKWRILEVNRACQFKGFEEATKIDVPQKLFEYLKTKK